MSSGEKVLTVFRLVLYWTFLAPAVHMAAASLGGSLPAGLFSFPAVMLSFLLGLATLSFRQRLEPRLGTLVTFLVAASIAGLFSAVSHPYLPHASWQGLLFVWGPPVVAALLGGSHLPTFGRAQKDILLGLGFWLYISFLTFLRLTPLSAKGPGWIWAGLFVAAALGILLSQRLWEAEEEAGSFAASPFPGLLVWLAGGAGGLTALALLLLLLFPSLGDALAAFWNETLAPRLMILLQYVLWPFVMAATAIIRYLSPWVSRTKNPPAPSKEDQELFGEDQLPDLSSPTDAPWVQTVLVILGVLAAAYLLYRAWRWFQPPPPAVAEYREIRRKERPARARRPAPPPSSPLRLLLWHLENQAARRGFTLGHPARETLLFLAPEKDREGDRRFLLEAYWDERYGGQSLSPQRVQEARQKAAEILRPSAGRKNPS
ncbi:MAG: hypothetical protein KM310_05465 [Clostridiales bacterium]|nr:hypothetical protein [Clostridiales bacterium]